ncbi:hypothetical protein JCM11641_000546 [Rhodosporidiobolus odoratus]
MTRFNVSLQGPIRNPPRGLPLADDPLPPSKAGSHIDLRKRNQAFQSKVGKVNKLNKQQDPLEQKAPLPKWLALGLILIVCGGVVFELLQAIFNAFFAGKGR